MKPTKTVSWFSAGVSSFVASWLLRDKIHEVVYIDIDDQHPDSIRFVRDCETLLGKAISVLKSPAGSVENALRLRGAIRFPHGAPCTEVLKKRVRKQWEREQSCDLCYVWGLDSDERDRAGRIVESMPKQTHRFPLIEQELSKQDAHGIAARLGLERPIMYDLGYSNNNCVGCVKGGMGYWNKIRVDFPEVFAARGRLERLIGRTILKGVYLDELEPTAGRGQKEILEDCGIMCELQVDAAGRWEG